MDCYDKMMVWVKRICVSRVVSTIMLISMIIPRKKRSNPIQFNHRHPFQKAIAHYPIVNDNWNRSVNPYRMF